MSNPITTAILEITNLAGNATDDFNARIAQEKTDYEEYQECNNNLPMNDDDNAGLDNIEQRITDRILYWKTRK